MRFSTGWYSLVTIDIPNTDTFALEAAKEFGFKLEPISHGFTRAHVTAKQANEFARHCE